MNGEHYGLKGREEVERFLRQCVGNSPFLRKVSGEKKKNLYSYSLILNKKPGFWKLEETVCL